MASIEIIHVGDNGTKNVGSIDLNTKRTSKHGTKGGTHANGTPYYGTDHFRPNGNGSGQVIADLYDANGVFHRTAIVADCGDYGRAVRYCKEQNERQEIFRSPPADENENPLVSLHEVRYYAVPPHEKTLETCRTHGKDHKAYHWRQQIDPRWSAEQIEAYRAGYSGALWIEKERNHHDGH